MDKPPAFSMMRVTEAIIISAITSALLSAAAFFIIVPVLRADFESFKNSQVLFNTEMRVELREINTKLWNLKGSETSRRN
jgi:hypothetical protein